MYSGIPPNLLVRLHLYRHSRHRIWGRWTRSGWRPSTTRSSRI
ncbi:MAG: hypothetical protein ACJ0HH_01420 [Candidatus Thalassarchaeum sp.]